MEVGVSPAVDLARRDLEREASELYKGYVVRFRLNRVPNEAVTCNVSGRKEDVRRFPFRYIESIKSLDGRVLGSNRDMREAFGMHFRDRFALCPELPVQEFRSYFTDFLHLREAEVATCEGLVTECEVRDTLKLVGPINRPNLMVYLT